MLYYLDVPIPSLSEELLTIVNVMKSFQSLYLKSGKDFDVDLPQMLSNIKKDNSLLPSDDLKKVYISIVDILSAQNALALWNKVIYKPPKNKSRVYKTYMSKFKNHKN